MRLLRLDIQQLPGIQPGFTVADISPGVNLVIGPNASGKSSLVRALRYLVSEPESTDPLALSLSASLEEQGIRWTVTRTGQQQEWQRDGQSVERPPLPEGNTLHCYWLTMEDLAVTGEGDAALVEALRRALTGGYDLRGLRGELFPEAPRAGQVERKRLREARGELRSVESGYEALRDLERELPELEDRIGNAQQASSRAVLLEHALALATVLEERQRLDDRLAAFPRTMESLRGNEAEQLTRLESQLAELHAAERKLHSQLSTREDELHATGLGQARPADHELEAVRSRLEELRGWRQRLEEVDVTLLQAGDAEKRARQALTGDAETVPGDLPSIGPEELARVEQLVDALERNRAAQAQITVPERGETDRTQDEEEIRRYWQGIDALEQWQAARAARRAQKGARPGLLLAATVAAVILVLSAMEQDWWVLLGSTAVLGGVLWGLYRLAGNPETQARESYRNLDLPPPDQWNADAVQARLATLRGEANERERRRLQELASLGEQQRLQQLRDGARRLAAERRQLAEELGFDPAREGVGIQRQMQLVADYEQARRQRRDRQTEKERLQTRIDGAHQAVRDFLAHWQVAESGDLHDLEAAFQALRQSAQRAGEAARAIRELHIRLEENREQQSDRRAEIDALYRDQGLAPEDRAGLDAALEQWPQWRTLHRERQELLGRERDPRGRLADHPELIQLAESGEREVLQEELDEQQSLASRLDEMRDRRSDIRGQLQSAGQNRQLEKALYRVDQEEGALRDRLEERLSAEAGRFLLDGVEHEHQSDHEPEVLREARQLFGRFTHRAWDIVVDDTGLSARDCRQEAVRPLSALSSGTRMQLLLAVRLAWTRRLERGRMALPLFLDEALTTSDESRFSEVASSLDMLSREEGRQVFYLSARHGEQSLWEQVTGHSPHRIDLAALRFGQAETVAPDYRLPPEPVIPAPGNDTAEEYAEHLGVPPVDPLHAAGDLPVFHLLRDDLELLYRLASDWRVSTLGQLEALLGSDSAVVAVPDAQSRACLAERCATARLWLEIWHQGRNRVVDSIALQRSGVVSEVFLDAVGEVASQVDGDPEALVEALLDSRHRVRKFGPVKVRALEEWLEQEGYITPGQPLAAEQRRRSVLHRLGERHNPHDAGRLIDWLEAGLPRK